MSEKEKQIWHAKRLILLASRSAAHTARASIAFALLAGCASTPPAPEPRLILQRVEARKTSDGKIILKSVEVKRNEVVITAEPMRPID